MPYGIQQPAISGQIARLEAHLGVSLFQRRPFALTPQGEELFQFVRPFFSQLAAVEKKLSAHPAQSLRIGASEIVLRDYLPPILRQVNKRTPRLRLELRQGYQPELVGWLSDRELDLAVTLIERVPAPGI